MPGAPHVRDAMNLNLAMRVILVSLVPCTLLGVYNTGFQANAMMARAGLESAPGWHGVFLAALGVGYDPDSAWASIWHGLLIFVPVLAVAMATGAFWMHIFARLRKRPHGGGFAVVALLFTLSLPPSVPLWQVALGMSFGIVVGREIFGGVGKNFLNPTLVGLAFLYVTYPTHMVGETAWAVHGLTGATDLRTVAEGTIRPVGWLGSAWMQSFVGLVPGPIGATSALASLIGGAIIVYMRVASLRIVTGIILGMIAAALLFNHFGDPAGRFSQLSWHWHLVLGSFAFGAIFLATDPVSAAMTGTGKWVYGFLIGATVVLIRVANPSHPDGVMFAVLFGNIFAPFIDYLVIRANIGRRERRYGRE